MHYNCFVETVPVKDRQAVYQELKNRGLVRFAYVLPDGRWQLAVKDAASALEAYNAVAAEKKFPALLTKARLVELMVSSPDMEVTALMTTRDPRVAHAENVRLAQITIASEPAFRRGVAYHADEQYLQAIECYDQAVKIEPEDIRAWHNKIIALTQMGRHQEALDLAENALVAYPDIGLLWEAHGRALVDMGRLVEAGKSWSKASNLNPNIAKRHAKTHDKPADIQFQELIRECKQAGKDPEKDITFWWERFASFANSGDADRMFLCLQMAATIGPDYTILISDAGMLLLPPGHLLLSPGMLPVDAKPERLGDFFQRMTLVAMGKKR